MFRENPAAVHPTPKTICLVVPLLSGLNDTSAIAEHYQQLAVSLAENSWKVHVLVASVEQDTERELETAQLFAASGITTTYLTQTAFPPAVTLDGPNQTPLLRASDKVRYSLRELHRECHFTHIEFADLGGLGFRTIQAKRMGLEWQDVDLLVKLHGPKLWLRHQQGRWAEGANDIAAEFAEHYAFRFADHQLCVNVILAEEMKTLGWHVRDEVLIVGNNTIAPSCGASPARKWIALQPPQSSPAIHFCRFPAQLLACPRDNGLQPSPAMKSARAFEQIATECSGGLKAEAQAKVAETMPSLALQPSMHRHMRPQNALAAETLPEPYDWLSAPSSSALFSTRETALVTVAIPYYNLGDYLEVALASVAGQSYSPLEVLVIDDGSTDTHAQQVFQAMQKKYPRFQFVTQKNAGIGAARNRALELAHGEFFLPFDADNIAHPDMVRHFVTALQRNPGLSAVSSYFLAFRKENDIRSEQFAYSYRPGGGPHFLSALINVYGDGNALFRTDALRAVGGYATDRDSSWEDWEVFVKLVQSGLQVDVVPEFLFYYRHREDSFSHQTDGFRNHQRVLRRFVEKEHLPAGEQSLFWNALAGFHKRLEHLENENRHLQRRLACRRYRLADWVYSFLGLVRNKTRGDSCFPPAKSVLRATSSNRPEVT